MGAYTLYDTGQLVSSIQSFYVVLSINFFTSMNFQYSPVKCPTFFLFCFIIVKKWYLLGKCSQSVPLFERFLLKKVGHFGVMHCTSFFSFTELLRCTGQGLIGLNTLLDYHEGHGMPWHDLIQRRTIFSMHHFQKRRRISDRKFIFK